MRVQGNCTRKKDWMEWMMRRMGDVREEEIVMEKKGKTRMAGGNRNKQSVSFLEIDLIVL